MVEDEQIEKEKQLIPEVGKISKSLNSYKELLTMKEIKIGKKIIYALKISRRVME